MFKKKKPAPQFHSPVGYTIAFQELDKWGVKLAGKNSNFIIRPVKGGSPNFFHRWMQRLLLGFYWSKYD